MIDALRGFELQYFGPDAPRVDIRPYYPCGHRQIFPRERAEIQAQTEFCLGKEGSGVDAPYYGKMIVPSIWTTHCGRYPPATCATKSFP